MYRQFWDIRSEARSRPPREGGLFFIPRSRACRTWTVTTADPAAAVKHRRSLIQGIDHRIAARMRERRTMLGLTSQQVGERIGTTYQQVLKYEKGTTRISAGR